MNHPPALRRGSFCSAVRTSGAQTPPPQRHDGEAGSASLLTSRLFLVVAVFILSALGLQDVPRDGEDERHPDGDGKPRRAVEGGAVPVGYD